MGKLFYIYRSGLQVSQDRAISFTFHVIVPKLIWNWTSNSEVHIRFGIKELGSWNDCGNFNILRLVKLEEPHVLKINRSLNFYF